MKITFSRSQQSPSVPQLSWEYPPSRRSAGATRLSLHKVGVCVKRTCTKGPAPHEILSLIHPCVKPTKRIAPIPTSECQKLRALTSEHSLPNHGAEIRSRAWRLNYIRSEPLYLYIVHLFTLFAINSDWRIEHRIPTARPLSFFHSRLISRNRPIQRLRLVSIPHSLYCASLKKKAGWRSCNNESSNQPSAEW